ncbi:PREDICTED: pectate lyase-like [Ipomoea nil]|uniref:pectate lyase-like n=1 Tax=Ipomoea nil TaxID=35883 RepID=UPI000901A875|nr:PREDICTED: pectate lyase-like [Ipomoea nil]
MAASTKILWWVYLALLSIAAVIPATTADVSDDVWKQREAEARRGLLQAYHPNPEKITTELNERVSIGLNETYNNRELYDDSNNNNNDNVTRRELRRKKGSKEPCRATNPIDQCWRCRADWSDGPNRFRLADCALGFAKGTTGGKGGRIYVVKDASDDDVQEPKAGTLRHAVIQKEPLWIVFAASMTIKLSGELLVQGNKTIDGRGAFVNIAGGAGMTLQSVNNVIIHNIKVGDIKSSPGGIIRDCVDHKGMRTHDEGDGITIFGSHHVWIDHVSMHNCEDGLIDAAAGATAVTVSNCHFTDHDKVLLFGANNEDSIDKRMQITLAFNHFGKRLHQRMPRCRWGLFHIVNNDYTHWEMYAVGGSSGATIISQGNRYIAQPGENFFKEVTHRDCPDDSWKKWTWVSSGDVFMNGAFFTPSGDPKGVEKYGYRDNLRPLSGKEVGRLARYSGHLGRCTPGRKC